VLINGVTGGIGSAAVQLCDYFDAEITAVCDEPRSDLIRSLGADRIIDYTKEDFTETAPDAAFDVVFDAVADHRYQLAFRLECGDLPLTRIRIVMLPERFCTRAVETMKTQYYTATSINGYLADEENSLDWLFQFGQIKQIEGVKDDYPRFIEQVGAVAMGSTTYEWIVEHENLLEDPEKWPYEVPVWVFSSRELPMVDGANIRFVEGDVAPVHDEMEETADGKNVWLVGGGDLVGQFRDNDLLDEIILSVAPVMLRSGAPLLPRSITTPPLKLANVQTGDAFVVLTYEVQRGPES
jgi:dihydrofolate reductase